MFRQKIRGVRGTHPQVDARNFPGGYDLDEIIAAIHFSAIQHVAEIPRTELETRIVERFWTGLESRHGKVDDPFGLRCGELVKERSSLWTSHLKLSWFALAYWSYVLINVRLEQAVPLRWHTDQFIGQIRLALYELGVEMTKDECIDEIDRFVPSARASVRVAARPVQQRVADATLTFLEYVRFLHRAALRRRAFVTSGLRLPAVGLVAADVDQTSAREIVSFLSSHRIRILRRADEVVSASRLLVLLSKQSIESKAFWGDVASWKRKAVTPMVLCLSSKADLYREPPRHVADDLWTWLRDTVAVELDRRRYGYSVVLRALETPHPRKSWWHSEDGMTVGLAVDLLGEGIPRPADPPAAADRPERPYPYGLNQTVLVACARGCNVAARHARNGFLPDPATGRHRPYAAHAQRLANERQRWCGDAYALPWFALAYRAWLTLAADVPGLPHSREGADHANMELLQALVSLGVHAHKADALVFLEDFVRLLPWEGATDPVAAVDERTATFLALVHHLSQAALAAHQPVQLAFPMRPCFVSYARPDETLAGELVRFVEGKGADVWFDLTSITLGTPLDDSLRDGVNDARMLFLLASAAADDSTYVHLEIEAALDRGLRIVPLTPEGSLPPRIAALRASHQNSFEASIPLRGHENEAALVLALRHLQRTPEEQRRWLQSQEPCVRMRDRLEDVRVKGVALD